MTRSKALRDHLGWSQKRMAEYLGVTQPVVCNIEGSQAESGPVSRLLDLLALEHDRPDLTAEGFRADDAPTAVLPAEGAGAAP